MKIRIISIHCILPDESDKDEMFLKLDGKKIWPESSTYHRLDAGESVSINLTIDVAEGWHELELWDYDYLTPNDHLGKFRFKVDQDYGKHTTSMTLVEKGSQASYILHWEILRA